MTVLIKMDGDSLQGVVLRCSHIINIINIVKYYVMHTMDWKDNVTNDVSLKAVLIKDSCFKVFIKVMVGIKTNTTFVSFFQLGNPFSHNNTKYQHHCCGVTC